MQPNGFYREDEQRFAWFSMEGFMGLVSIVDSFSKKPLIPERWNEPLEMWLKRIQRVLLKGRID